MIDVGYNIADKNYGAVVYSKNLFKEQCLLHLEVGKGTYIKSTLFQAMSKINPSVFATCELQKVSSELRAKCILKHSFVIWCDLCCS
jgi:hypothetical protein